MAQNDIPQHVRQLIVRHIESVQQVEIICLLSEQPERAFSAADVSRALHIAPGPCAAWLEALATGELIERREGSAYGHAGSGAADDLVDCYSRRRLGIIDSIYRSRSG